MLNIVPIAALQQKTKKCVDRVRAIGHRTVITQRDRAAAVPVTADDFKGYRVTLDAPPYSDWRARLRRAKSQAKHGKRIEVEALFRKQEKRRGR